HARDLAGYEAQLLFDTTAAHFSGLHQRDSDLRKFGRDVIPLEATELVDGAAMGLASCKFADCVHPGGNLQAKGANGRLRLATVLVGTDQEGALELSLENVKLVNALGNPVEVILANPRIVVQVGAAAGRLFPAPGSSWQWAANPAAARAPDLTSDGQVDYADAIETALEWKLSREAGQPCGPGSDPSRDVNGDGCIDVADIQQILGAQADRQANGAAFPGNRGPKSAPTAAGMDAQPAANLDPAAALTLTVNATGDQADVNIGDGVCDSGAGCTLRAAIQEANRHLGPDTIQFNIPGGGVQTIQLSSKLPSLSDGSGGTTIDGYSQPGAQANSDPLVSSAVILIQIRGSGSTTFDLLQIQSSGNRVQGLSFFNGRRSVWLYGSGAANNVIVGNFIGTNAAGSFVSPNPTTSASGVTIEIGASGNFIGGPTPAERNVISGSARHGVEFRSEGTDSNQVMNNLIGLNPAGSGALMNLRHGIDMNAGPSYNVIGGTTPDRRNIISGNGENQNASFTSGIEISHDPLTSYNEVLGNCFGTQPDCTSAPAWASNRHYNIRMEDGVNNNTIAGNVIVNGPRGAIRMTGSGTNRNHIYDNRIGVTLNGAAAPNGNFGIQIGTSSKFGMIGPNNIIANNPVAIQLTAAGDDQHTITQNSIYNNTRLGIDLGTITGVTPNDVDDADSGSNEELNFPVLTSATPTSVSGTACAEAVVSKPCTVEIFIAERKTNDSGAGNYGQGKTFIGSGTTNASGAFAIPITGAAVGQYLTATATDASGNTSEFALNIQVAEGSPSISLAADAFSRSLSGGWGSADTGGSYSLSGTAANFSVDGSAGQMTIPNAGQARSVYLRGVTALDLNFAFRVKADKTAAGSNQSVYFIARGVSTNNEYWVQMRIAANQAVYLRAARVINGSQTSLGAEVPVPGLTQAADQYIWVKGQVTGANPTTISVKAWADGQSEPANWQYTVTDAYALLQAAGAVGLRSFLTSGITNPPVVFTFDDLLVTTP
ncbi:MAG: Ig-like domain-containing protein, partial [Chloroflexota bacterium]